MAFEYVEIGGKELINPSRTLAYIERHLPGLDIECDVPNVGRQLGSGDYTNPEADNAPWITADDDGHDFYGGIPSGVEGLRDSTMTTAVSELKQDGGVIGLHRNSSREMRFVVTLYAKTEAALQYGIDWYASALSGGYCPAFGVPYCEGEPMMMMPIMETMSEMAPHRRTIHDVKALQSVKVVETLRFRNAKAKVIEFILIAGNPFIFRSDPIASHQVLAQDMTQTVSEVYCDPEAEAFDQLITDPALGSVVRPPRPPMINPIEMPESWRRTSVTFTEEELDLPGQAVFRTTIRSTGTLRRLRVRFYRPGADACDYSGEFFISYKPPGDDLVIDGVSRKIWVERGGRLVPAGNLVVGSDARPLEWPILDCGDPVEVRVEYPTAPSNLTVDVEAFNRR